MLRNLVDVFLRIIAPSTFIGLNTQRIDTHIDELRGHQWFNSIYQDEKYRKLFFTNVHVRRYLESKLSVSKLMYDPAAREKFINLLEKQRK